MSVSLRSKNQSIDAAFGDQPEPLSAIGLLSERRWISAKQSPPMPVWVGSTTVCTAAAQTAASIALPPARRISIAASVACGCEVAAMPFMPTASERPHSSKSR